MHVEAFVFCVTDCTFLILLIIVLTFYFEFFLSAIFIICSAKIIKCQ